jgi:predicted dehydrogenase
MTAIPVLVAGTVGSGAQHHQAEMWTPAFAAAGLEAVGVWTPPTVDAAALARARSLAGDLGLELEVSERPSTPAAGAVVCLRGAERIAFARFAAERGMPILLDKPTLDPTAQVEELAAAVGDGVVMAGHHLSSHPGFTRALTAVRGAEIGLLRAVHADLVSGGGDRSPDGELRNLGVYLVELIRQATGPATVTLQATATPQGDAWTLLGRTDREVVVSAHVSRAGAAGGQPRSLRARLRLVGTHGSLLVDLTKPTIGLATTAATSTVPFVGESSVVAHLRRFAGAIDGTVRIPPASDLVTLSRALDAIAASAATVEAAPLTW